MSYTGYLQHVMGVFLVPKQQHTTTSNSWRFLASQPVPKIWKFLTSKNTNYQQKVPLFLWSNSWSHGTPWSKWPTTTCIRFVRRKALPLSNCCWNCRLGHTDFNLKMAPVDLAKNGSHRMGAKLMPVVQSECTMTSVQQASIFMQHKKTICTLCWIFFRPHVIQSFSILSSRGIFFKYWLCDSLRCCFFPRTFAGKPATASPIYNLPVQRQVLPHLWLVAQNILYGSRIWPGLIV